MTETINQTELERLLAEAEELLNQLEPELLAYLQKEERAHVGEQVQNLKKLQAEVQDQVNKQEGLKVSSYGEGMHEAIVEIGKAMKALARYLA
jgi:hypothetical protein